MSRLLTLTFRLLAHLPLRALHGLGALAGQLTRRLDGRYRQHLHDNLALAGLADATLAGRSAGEAGKGVFELPWLWLRPPNEVLARTTVRNWDLVDAARAEGRGIIFLTPHLGCFEVTAQYYASNPRDGAPITVLYREPHLSWLRPLIAQGRARPNLSLARADVGGVRQLVRALRRGEAIGLLPDQVPSAGEGVWAPFFGRPAYTMTLPARLQAMSGAVLLLAFGERLPNGRGWVVHLQRFTGELSGDAARQAGIINGALEDIIRQCPEQYLWGYNRYKVPKGMTAAPGTPGAAGPPGAP